MSAYVYYTRFTVHTYIFRLTILHPVQNEIHSFSVMYALCVSRHLDRLSSEDTFYEVSLSIVLVCFSFYCFCFSLQPYLTLK